MTGGAFSGLDQSFYDDDEAKLEACRPNGERASVAHLSEGARDQLYLALRLAYTQDYAARAEAPPFIGDDIFASFDDFRTGNGLEALAAMGDRIQPILFTHHLHVIEQAKARLGRRSGHHPDRLSPRACGSLCGATFEAPRPFGRGAGLTRCASSSARPGRTSRSTAMSSSFMCSPLGTFTAPDWSLISPVKTS